MKPEYLELCCKNCGRYDDDEVFNVGFREPVLIRVKGDFAHTQDRVFVVNDRLLSVFKKAKVRGYETKPVGKTGWHALKTTERVEFADGVMNLVEPSCPECGRAKSTTGCFEHRGQLSVPHKANTLFTTKRRWPSMFQDRLIFFSEDVVKLLKESGIKGGYFNRLWTDEEVRTAEEKAKDGKKWKPKGATVFL